MELKAFILSVKLNIFLLFLFKSFLYVDLSFFQSRSTNAGQYK